MKGVGGGGGGGGGGLEEIKIGASRGGLGKNDGVKVE